MCVKYTQHVFWRIWKTERTIRLSGMSIFYCHHPALKETIDCNQRSLLFVLQYYCGINCVCGGTKQNHPGGGGGRRGCSTATSSGRQQLVHADEEHGCVGIFPVADNQGKGKWPLHASLSRSFCCFALFPSLFLWFIARVKATGLVRKGRRFLGTDTVQESKELIEQQDKQLTTFECHFFFLLQHRVHGDVASAAPARKGEASANVKIKCENPRLLCVCVL